jgi:hypothetical protein
VYVVRQHHHAGLKPSLVSLAGKEHRKTMKSEYQINPVIGKLLENNTLEQPLVIEGYIGAVEQDVVRIYKNINTSAFFDVPKDSILHSMDIADGQQIGRVRVYIKPSAQIRSVSVRVFTGAQFSKDISEKCDALVRRMSRVLRPDSVLSESREIMDGMMEALKTARKLQLITHNGISAAPNNEEYCNDLNYLEFTIFWLITHRDLSDEQLSEVRDIHRDVLDLCKEADCRCKNAGPV